MVLVTGATGLLGIHLLMELTQNEALPIRAMYRSISKKEEAQKVFFQYNDYTAISENWEKIEWIQADITEIPDLEKAFEGVSQVYHCAGYISFDVLEFDLLKKINIEGTANVVHTAMNANVKKFCHVSSIATLNLNPGETIFNEQSQWNPEAENSVYAISKFGGEMEVWKGIQEGLNAVIVNPGVVLGSGFFESGSGKLFSKVNKGMPFFTSGATAYIGVGDTVKIMCSLMSKPIANERYVLIAENLSYKKVLTLIAKQLNVKPPAYEIKKTGLKLFSYGQLLISFLFRKKASICLDMVESLCAQSIYDSSKIVKKLDYKFEPISKVIVNVCNDLKSSDKL